MKPTDRHDPIELLRAANPASAVALQAEITLDEHVGALDRALALGAARVGAPTVKRARRRLTRPRIFGLSAAASAVAVAAALLLLGGSPVGPSEPEFAGAAIKVAESSPRLLVEAPGWSVSSVGAFQTTSGRIEFSNGGDDLLINWMRIPAKLQPRFSGPKSVLPKFDQWYRMYDEGCTRPVGGPNPQCRIYERHTRVDVLGRPAALHEQVTISRDGGEKHQFFAGISYGAGIYLTLVGSADSRQAFLSLLGSVREVDTDSWLDALPPDIVDPLERPEIVAGMLRGVPIPPSLDADELSREPSAGPKIDIRTTLLGAVACGWLDQWREARASGDVAASNAAIDAMASAHDWPVVASRSVATLRSFVTQAAQNMRKHPGLLLRSGGLVRTAMDGSTYYLRPAYAATFGCASGTWFLEPGTAGTRSGFGPPPVPVAGPR